MRLVGTHFSEFSKLTFEMSKILFLAKIGQITNFAKFSTRKQKYPQSKCIQHVNTGHYDGIIESEDSISWDDPDMHAIYMYVIQNKNINNQDIDRKGR